MEWQVFKANYSFKPKPTLFGVVLVSALLLLAKIFFPQHFTNPFPIWWLSLWIIVGQPLLEEYVFRHLLQKIILLKLFPFQRKFKPNQNYTIFVILIVAFIFALTHFKTHPELSIVTFLNGIIYGFAYNKSNSLTPGWVAHMTCNFLSFAL